MIENSENVENLAKRIAETLDEKNAQELKILDLRGLESAVSDYFIICSSKNSVHAQSLVDWVLEVTHRDLREKPFNIEGKDNAEWILLDYVDIVVHVFSEDKRNFIKLDDLWADAKEVQFLNS